MAVTPAPPMPPRKSLPELALALGARGFKDAKGQPLAECADFLDLVDRALRREKAGALDDTRLPLEG